jgi:sortase A
VSALRAAARTLGELMITAGLVLLLFCVYQLVWTNVEAHREQSRVSDSIRQEWQRQQPTPGGKPLDVRAFRTGTGFAFLHVPALGRKYSVPVVQGVSLPDLSRGVGHYPRTALPGSVGNFAVAGHRATNGEPFAHLDKVHKGDAVVVETRNTWFTYVIDSTRIVQPTDTWVIDPVPGKKGVRPTRRLLTLTTCNPRWASTQRLILFGHLAGQQPRGDGRPAVLAAGG